MGLWGWLEPEPSGVEAFAGGMQEWFGRFGWWPGGWDGDGVSDQCATVFVGEGESVGFVGVAGDDDLAAMDEVMAAAACGCQVRGFGEAVVAAVPEDMMDLEAEGAVTAGDAAVVPVAVQDHSTKFR